VGRNPEQIKKERGPYVPEENLRRLSESKVCDQRQSEDGDKGGIVTASSTQDLKRRANNTIELARNWIGIHGLKIAPEKSEAILLRSRGPPGQSSFKIGEHGFALSKTLTYLGVTLDNHGTFEAHVTRVTNKANTKLAKLARLLPNIAGPNSKTRAMLYETVQ
ncbi:hypothetical protein ILUMI_16629, partial [Ignelater luminosus]